MQSFLSKRLSVTAPPSSNKPGRKESVVKTGRIEGGPISPHSQPGAVSSPKGEMTSPRGAATFDSFFGQTAAPSNNQVNQVGNANQEVQGEGVVPRPRTKKANSVIVKGKSSTATGGGGNDWDSMMQSFGSNLAFNEGQNKGKETMKNREGVRRKQSADTSSDDSSSSSSSSSESEEETERKERRKKKLSDKVEGKKKSKKPDVGKKTGEKKKQRAEGEREGEGEGRGEGGEGGGEGKERKKRGDKSMVFSAGNGPAAATSPRTRAYSTPVTPTLAPSSSSSNERWLNIDVLAVMHKGTSFLKYGRYGYPHFRLFQISDDNSRVVWFSGSKKISESQVNLEEVVALKFGQTTPTFERHAAPELTRSSFSLIYGSSRKSLDIIAKDPNDYRVWTQGLTYLIGLFRSGKAHEAAELKNVVLPIAVLRGKRSTPELLDFNTQACADEATAEELNRPYAIVKSLPSKIGDKTMHLEVRTQIGEMRRKYVKRRGKIETQMKYRSSLQYDAMVRLLDKIGKSLEKVDVMYREGDYQACDDELWRATVDLESLDNIVKSVK